MIIGGGSILTSGGMFTADIRISGAEIVEVGPDLDGDDRFDAERCWVGPSFVDLHTHLREPGQEWKEDLASGREAAAAGGFTTVVAMPNTDPPIDSGHVAAHVRRTGGVEVVPAGCLTLARQGVRLAHLDDLWTSGVRIFTDDGDTVADAGLLRRAMEYLAQLGGVVAQHAEDPGLARGGHMHEGSVSSRLGITGLPAVAEEVIVARDIRLVEVTGCRYHVQHVSTAGTVDLIRQAKAARLPVTAEVTPHHLVFDHRSVESMDPVFKMYPPLRTPDDVAAVKSALRDGVIDCVATDHAPHSAHEKDVPFEEAPRGVIGLETAAAVLNAALDLAPTEFFERLSGAPRRILGREPGLIEVGAPADIVVFDPVARWTAGTFRSRSENSPWTGSEMVGQVRLTVAGGDVVHVQGET
ncbi:MAG TPA: dihydroorotase [Acidimicrobiia bacterium]|nr:dihydroorotase [Acidimicrobiia bacterium]